MKSRCTLFIMTGLIALMFLSMAGMARASESALAQNDEVHRTGLLPPTPEQREWMEKNMRMVKSIKTTQLGLDRINAEKRKKGRSETLKSAVLLAPIGEDLETVNAASAREKAIGGSGAPLGFLASDLPASVDNSTTKWFPPVVEQKFNDCAQVSLVSYTYTYMTAMARDWDAKAGGNAVHFNSAWTYNMVNGGALASGWFAWSILQQNGCALMSDWPESNSFKAWCTDGDVWRKAINFRAGDTVSVGGLDASDNTAALNRVKTLLNNGYIFNVGTGIATWHWLTVGNDPATANDDAWGGKNIIYFSKNTPDDTDGHALTVVGYNDDIWCDINRNGRVDIGEKGALRICNSWGTSWEDNGFCWIAYDALKTVSDVPNYPSGYIDRTPGGIFYGTVYGITARASYTPRVLAKVTLNAGKRNQINITNGFMQSGRPKAAFNSCLLRQGGEYAFDGGYTAVDGTFYFDLSDVAPAGVSGSYYLELRDSNLDGFATTLKEFAILDLEARRQKSSIEVPASIDGSTRTFQLDYSREGQIPTLNTDEDISTALDAGNFGQSGTLAFTEVQIISLPAKGTLNLGGVPVTSGQTVAAANIGNLTYQSAPNENGAIYATIGFKVKNASSIWSAPEAMTVNVSPVNDAPTSTGGSVNLDGSATKTFSASDFRFADVDAGDTLGAIQVTSLPALGTLKLNTTAITEPGAVIPLANIGTLSYTAGAGYSVSDSFTFKVRDTVLFSADATMTITGSSTFAELTATNPLYSTTDYLTNTKDKITNTVTAAALNSLSIDTTAGSNTWDLTTGKTATITTGGLNMTGANNFTIENGMLKSASSSGFTVTQNGAGTLTLSSVIANGSGNSPLTKAGTGILTLSGANTYSGATTISGGILNLTNALALQNSALDTTNSVVGSATAGLKTDQTSLTLGGLTGNKNLASVFTTALGGTAGTTASGGYSGVTALTLNPGSGVTTYAGSISDGTVGMALTKTGAGTQTLSGANTLTNATVNGGTLGMISGGSLSLANGFVQAGSTVPGILKIDGGSLSISGTGNNTGGLAAGGSAGNLGAIYLNSGSILCGNGFNLHIGGVGYAAPTYGFLNITGGTISGPQQRTRIGQYGGTGLWYQSGGIFTNVNSSSIDVGSSGTGGTNIGVVYLSGSAQFTSSTAINVASANVGIATLTVAGSAAVMVNAGLTVGAASGTTATVNLNGGTLTFKTITNNATGTFNFNGGSLKADSASASFSGTGAAYVYPGGLTFNTNGNAVTIPLALQAPAGSGVATIPMTSAGSGYIGAPYVALSGNGTGATAVANMVDDGTGNGTYKIGSISVTSPGRNYTNINATLSGGLPAGGTAAVLNTASATFVSNAGGGLTKIGSGTLTLTATNTYTGDTRVSEGVLAVKGSSLADTSKLIIDGGKVDLTNEETVGTLFFGTTQQAAGTYSATGAGGTIASTHFTGTGTLRVNPSPGSTPTITTSGTLSAMNTTFGTASNPTPFTVAGANMTVGITVTPPAGFEVSQTVGGASGYAGSGTAITVGSSGTIATTTVYVRLAVTAPVGTYNSQNIVLSSTGATAKNVTTAASNNFVSAPPPLITLAGTLGAVNTTYGTALATPTSFSVAASNLTPASGNLTVTAPTGYEVSLNNSSGYSSNLSVSYSSSTLASTPVYARLAATANVVSSPYSGNITVAGGDASLKTIATVSSTVAKATPVVSVTPYSVTYDGNPHSATVTSITGVNGETGATVGVVNLNTTHTNAGTYATDSWSLTGTANYNNIASTTLTNTINKATPTATLAVSNSSVPYDGTAKSATVNITGSSVPGEVQNVLTGGAATQTAAGIYAVTANFVPTDTTNYETLTALAAGNFVIGGITIPVINGNFETEYGSNTDKTKNWVKLTAWSLNNTNIGSVDIAGAFSSSADGGSKFTRFTYNDAGAEQNLNTNVAVGDTLSVTFNIGIATNALVGANTTGVVYFKIGSQFYYQDCDVSSHPVGTWKSFTFTTTATNAGALSLGFRVARTTANNQYASVDGVSNVTRISSATPTITTSGTLSTLSTTYGTFSATTSFTVSGANMAAGIAVTPPAGFEVSQTAGGASGYAGSGTAITVGSSGTIATTSVYVRLAATATVGSSPYSGNITCVSPGAITQNVATASSTVAKATPTATLAVNNSPTTYDGTPKAATVIINASSVLGGVQNILTGGAATQTAAGSYAVTANFVPTDAANYNTLTAQGAGNFVINPTYDAWAQTFLPGNDVSNPSGDNDQDGTVNLLEYAFGKSPIAAEPSSIVGNLSGSLYRLSFPCKASCTDLTYTVQCTSNLATGSWTDIARSTGGAMMLPISTLSTVADTGAGLRTVTVTDTSAIPAGGSRFYRLKISRL